MHQSARCSQTELAFTVWCRYGVKDWKKEMDRWNKAYQCSRVLEELVVNRSGPTHDENAGTPLQCGEMLDQHLELDKRPPLSLIVEYCVVRPAIEQNKIVNRAAMHLFIEELNLKRHLQLLRRYRLGHRLLLTVRL